MIDEILEFLIALLGELRRWNRARPSPAVRLVVSAGTPTPRKQSAAHDLSFSGDGNMATTLTHDQQMPLTVHGLNVHGAVTTTFGSVPAWTVDPAFGTMTVAPDGLSSTFVPSQVGDAVITVSALAAAGDATPLTATVTLTVTHAAVENAVQLVIVTGEPEPKPA